MNRRDLHTHILLGVALASTAIADGEDAVGNIIDRFGSDALELQLHVTARTDGTVTPLIEHGDDAALADAATVPAEEILGTAAAMSAVGIQSLGYIGNKRYVRVTAQTAAGATLTVYGSYIKGALHLEGEV